MRGARAIENRLNNGPGRLDCVLAYEEHAISLHRISKEPFISINLSRRIFDGSEGGWHRNQFFSRAFHLGIQADGDVSRSKTEAKIVVTARQTIQRSFPKLDVHIGRCQWKPLPSADQKWHPRPSP